MGGLLPNWVRMTHTRTQLVMSFVSGLMLAGYMLVDILVALWLAGWHPGGTLTWAVMILGFLCAGVYNFIVSDYLAGRVEDGA